MTQGMVPGLMRVTTEHSKGTSGREDGLTPRRAPVPPQQEGPGRWYDGPATRCTLGDLRKSQPTATFPFLLTLLHNTQSPVGLRLDHLPPPVSVGVSRTGTHGPKQDRGFFQWKQKTLRDVSRATSHFRRPGGPNVPGWGWGESNEG